MRYLIVAGSQTCAVPMAEPLAPTARVVTVESKVPRELEQLLVVQTSKVTLPVSWLSGSLKVAVRVGVAVLRRAASAGGKSAGGSGEHTSAVLSPSEPVYRALRV